MEDYEPYIYRTRDGGKTWQKITKGLPAGIFVQTVKEDPLQRGLLFAGTERGVFVSFNDRDDWQSLQLNLPPASMRDLDIHGDDLIVATHGRGFWVLDNIPALRQIDDAATSSEAFLFKSADAINMPAGNEYGTPLPKDEPFAENPPAGAMIDYWLKSSPSGPVLIEILDASEQVRVCRGPRTDRGSDLCSSSCFRPKHRARFQFRARVAKHCGRDRRHGLDGYSDAYLESRLENTRGACNVIWRFWHYLLISSLVPRKQPHPGDS